MLSNTLRKLALSLSSKEDPTVWKGKYLSIRKKDGWYEYLHDGNAMLVIVLGYRRLAVDQWQFLGRYETCPPHSDGLALCALTGGIEEGEEPIAAAARELEEESGIKIEQDKFTSLGTARPSKASDSTAYFFAVSLEIPEQDKYVGKGDGTEGEKGSYCTWINYNTAIEAKDPLLIAAVARMRL